MMISRKKERAHPGPKIPQIRITYKVQITAIHLGFGMTEN
jgi:hypothetical protein